MLIINLKKSIMFRRQNHALAGLAIAACLAAGGAGTAHAGEELRPRQDKVSMGEEAVKQLLPLMADEKGEVSEESFMKYMQEEFGRLSKDENGQVNVRAVTNQLSRPLMFSSGGK